MSSFKQFLAEANFHFSFTDISQKGKAANRLAMAKAIGFSAKLKEMQPFFKNASASSFMSDFNKFVSKFPTEAMLIDKNKIDGIGPGEQLAYFIFNNIGVGGKNSPIDLYLDGKEWAEAKAGAPVGASTLTNFKITADSADAVNQIQKDLESFNEKHIEITGEDLPGWRSAMELKTETLRSWKDIDLKKMAAESKGGSKNAIHLVLKKDGDLTQKGDSETIINVKKDKSITPLRDLITSGGKIVVDDKISTLEKIIRSWAKKAHEEYVDGKRFVLFSSKSGKQTTVRYVGYITPDMIGLYATNRNQPWAEVYLEPKKSEEK